MVEQSSLLYETRILSSQVLGTKKYTYVKFWKWGLSLRETTMAVGKTTETRGNVIEISYTQVKSIQATTLYSDSMVLRVCFRGDLTQYDSTGNPTILHKFTLVIPLKKNAGSYGQYLDLFAQFCPIPVEQDFTVERELAQEEKRQKREQAEQEWQQQITDETLEKGKVYIKLKYGIRHLFKLKVNGHDMLQNCTSQDGKNLTMLLPYGTYEIMVIKLVADDSGPGWLEYESKSVRITLDAGRPDVHLIAYPPAMFTPRLKVDKT